MANVCSRDLQSASLLWSPGGQQAALPPVPRGRAVEADEAEGGEAVVCGGEGGAGQPGLGGAGRQVGVRGLQVRELPPPAINQ